MTINLISLKIIYNNNKKVWELRTATSALALSTLAMASNSSVMTLKCLNSVVPNAIDTSKPNITPVNSNGPKPTVKSITKN